MFVSRLSVVVVFLSCLTPHVYSQFSNEVVLLSALSGYLGGFISNANNEECGEDCFTECDVNVCGTGAKCLEEEGGVSTCLCPSGFTGTGTSSCTADACSTNPCDPNGDCALSSDATNDYVCICNAGYRFDGTTCVADACNANPCDPNGDCALSTDAANGYICSCNAGFRFDGTTCVADACNANPCNPNGDCALSPDAANGYICSCNAGFRFDGTTCVADACNANPCDPNGDCALSPDAANDYICKCNTGFRFDGTTCVADACNGNTCGANGACIIDSTGSSKCCCNEGFEDRNGVCVQRCPDGTVKYENANDRICYYPLFDHLDQVEAAEACEDAYANGNLAPIPDLNAQQLIDNGKFFAFTQTGSDGFWIGATDAVEDGDFVDPLTSPNAITFENFDDATGQPNGGAVQNCVAVFPQEDFKWQDKACSDTFQALCSVNIEL